MPQICKFGITNGILMAKRMMNLPKLSDWN
ncbi:hypothetical protein EG68_12229 [Paragonimus skrjabini miyazakii]|uniref:Uncharacterized protein n=1 Tax=Paragonimus skrjabini miyazakii TaxID=59628 RepID=A0A8S9YNE4_9TREM|nr:hypothetical protein EG68_12229 [Paragonimus skrjabini miyazakii]